jgi:hypothetical protein
MHSELELGDELAVWEIQYNFGGALNQGGWSCCPRQSGMRETTLPDEAIGLPSAFLQAGTGGDCHAVAGRRSLERVVDDALLRVPVRGTRRR